MTIRENEQQMERLWQQIALCLVDMSVEGWRRMILGVFQDGDAQVTAFFVQLPDGGVVNITKEITRSRDSGVMDAYCDLCDACEELHDLCSAQNDDWTSMSFWVMPSGSFNAEFDYEPFEVFDSDILEGWKQRAFAFLDEEE